MLSETPGRAELTAVTCLWWVAVVVAILTFNLLSTPSQAQGPTQGPTQDPTAISLSWDELKFGCETTGIEAVDVQQCRSQLARWRAEYEAPRQQPDLLMPTLDRVLAELPTRVEPDQSLWNRLWRWIREALGGGATEVPEWLRDWDIPETFVNWMIGLSVGACVLLALGIVGNELLQVYRSRAMVHVPGDSANGIGTGFTLNAPTLAEVTSYPLQEQPGMVLHIVLNQLQQRSLMPRQVGRTHQDLLQQAPQLGELGESLADITQAAERSTYGNWRVSSAEVVPLIKAGERLVAPEVAPRE